jgi:hypothetical protein
MFIKGTFIRSNEFLKNTVNPYLNKKGLKYYAVAMNADIFTQFAMNALLKVLGNQYQMKILRSPQEAKIGLEEKMGASLDIPGLFLKDMK